MTWQPFDTAPRDRPIIARLGTLTDDRYDHWSGRCFVVHHMGYSNNLNLDLGWALFPGMGVGDEWFEEWAELPPSPQGATVKEK